MSDMCEKLLAITRGTTPTISYKFKVIDPNNIEVAFLTLEQGNETVVEKDLSDASVDADRITWRLTQSETLRLRAEPHQMKVPPVTMQLRYRLKDGSAHATSARVCQLFPVIKDGEI